METKKKHQVFIQGSITPEFIANSITKHSTKTGIGAHDIFLGQVRKDTLDGKQVKAIEYTAYQDMCQEVFDQIREETFQKFELSCMHIYHSIGEVGVGEICLFVFVSSAHRQSALDACRWVVEEIKAKVPVFGREIFEDDTHVWKKNS